MYFYPRPPRGGRPSSCTASSRKCSISIHALREEGDDARRSVHPQRSRISIHALREEGDARGPSRRGCRSISIHALREEGDDDRAEHACDGLQFLSTPSARRATFITLMSRAVSSGFLSTPSARRATAKHSKYKNTTKFLSTPSARRATDQAVCFAQTLEISIHALREEGDHSKPIQDRQDRNFYPRPPRGGRHTGRYKLTPTKQFLSTPSARRATEWAKNLGILKDFYPRPPRGGRRISTTLFLQIWEFLSTPSARRATTIFFEKSQGFFISIHALREEGDLPFCDYILPYFLFLSTPSARRATGQRQAQGVTRVFLSTPSARRATFWRL